VARLLGILLGILAGAYVLVVVGMYAGQRTLLYPGATRDATPPAQAPWGAKVAISTPDGETLFALHRTVPDARATILFLHGNGDDIARYGFLAEALAARGYALLALSFRGYPGSTGTPTEAGLLADGLAAFDWLTAQDGAPPIVLLGRSLGTGVAVHTAAERDAAALVLVSAYQSIAAVAARQYPYLPVAALIKDSYRADQWIGRVDEPKLFLHGDRDGLIPIDSGQALFAAASEPKTFVVEAGRGHNDIWTDALVMRIADFADAVVAGDVR